MQVFFYIFSKNILCIPFSKNMQRLAQKLDLCYTGKNKTSGGIFMASIQAFKALRYNTEKCGQLKDVLAPPYDIITPERQEKLYAQSEYNIVRLTYGQTMPTDSDTDNRYTRAKAQFDAWLKDGIMQTDSEECLYFYEQEFDLKHHHYIHRGFITLLKLEAFDNKVVLPHELTTQTPTADRLKLLEAIQAFFNPVYCLFPDEEKVIHAHTKSICNTAPDIDFVHENGKRQRIWCVNDKAVIDAVTKELADKQVFIADGHHRYEAALSHRDACRAQNLHHTGEESYNYTLAYLSSVEDPGIVIFPTHRMITSIGMDESTAISFLKDDFIIERIIVDKRISELAEAIGDDLASKNDSKIYALYFGGDYYYRIRPKNPREMDALLPDKSEAYRNLDVVALDKLLLEKYFNISGDDAENPSIIDYTRITADALEAVQSGKRQCCVILKPTKVRELTHVSLASEQMPAHSTYFYPKPLSGLVMHKL